MSPAEVAASAEAERRVRSTKSLLKAATDGARLAAEQGGESNHPDLLSAARVHATLALAAEVRALRLALTPAAAGVRAEGWTFPTPTGGTS